MLTPWLRRLNRVQHPSAVLPVLAIVTLWVVVGFGVVPNETIRRVVVVVVVVVVFFVVVTLVVLATVATVVGACVGRTAHFIEKLAAVVHEPSRHFHEATICDGQIGSAVFRVV